MEVVVGRSGDGPGLGWGWARAGRQRAACRGRAPGLGLGLGLGLGRGCRDGARAVWVVRPAVAGERWEPGMYRWGRV